MTVKKRKRNPLPGLICGFAVVLLVLGTVLLLMSDQEPAPATQPTESPHPSQSSPSSSEPPPSDSQSSEPALLNGWTADETGRHYYIDGVLQTGWQDIDGQRYYLGQTGVMQSGWLELEDKTYYLNSDGTLARGQVEIDGRNRFFTSAGAEVLVVNPWNFLPEDYEADLLLLNSEVALEDMWVDRSCYEALNQMILDCNAYMNETYGGTDMWARAYVLSAYRTYEHQTQLYTSKVNLLMSQGYSREDAEKTAATVNAYPGTSEHQLGLAVDIIDTHLWKLTAEQANLPAQKWLMENSWRYGFILRFPKGKTDVTGIIFEPWHYRYVGVELATELFDLGLTVEEYMNSLS